MAVKVAINGFGRIGRNVLRAIIESGRTDIEVVAINDLGPVETNAHLLRYDSVHGRFPATVTVSGDTIDVGRGPIKVTAIRNPADLPWAEIDVIMECTMDYDSLQKAGSAIGAGSVIVMDETTCMVRMLERISYFYYAESCGQCTPCREGTGWLYRVINRIRTGRGRMEDLDLLVDMANRIEGRTICALGDAAAWPVQSFMKHYRHEFEAMIRRAEAA